MPVADNDLVACHPLERFDGACCPCPEHRPEPRTANFQSCSPRLALWRDVGKTNAIAIGDAVEAGEAVYVEGLGKSTSPGAEEILWEYAKDGKTRVVTNAFTVLSQRVFADLDFDGDVDAADKALHPSLPPAYGWAVPVAGNVFRKVQLRTDVGLPGMHFLSLSGDGFRVWRSAHPAPGESPLLVGGQTVTNGVGGVSWDASAIDHVYIEAVTNGAAHLTYAFLGAGAAAGVVSRASLRMMVPSVGPTPDHARAQASTNRETSL